MILFRLLVWPYIRQHFLRTLLTAVGITLGVALFFAMHTANRSVLFALHETIDRIAGATQLQVTAGDAGFDEEVLERVQALPEIRAAAPVVEAVTRLEHGSSGSVLVLGVDMTGDRSLRDYRLEDGDELEDPLVFLAQPDSVIVAATLARKLGLGIGSHVPMETMQGRKILTVRGLMREGGLASAFGGQLMIMDIYAAQKVFGRGAKFDRIDLAVKDGVPVEAVRARLAALLGSGFQVQEPAARANEFNALSRVFSAVTDLTSAFALFVGIFLINNTLQTAVTHRRAEIGILRSLGATRTQIAGLFLGQGAAAGLAGSLAGVAFGTIAGRAITGYISRLLADSYGVAQRVAEVSANPDLILGAVGLGVMASIVAAVLPARAAASVEPVVALQKAGHLRLAPGEWRRRGYVALALAFVAWICVAFMTWNGAVYLGDFLAILAAILITPAAIIGLTRLARPILCRIRPVEGAMACDSVLSEPRRSAGAVTALMLSVALITALGGVGQAAFGEIRNWLDAELSADLYLSPSQSLTAREFRFPAAVLEEISTIAGIAGLEAIRELRIPVQAAPTLLIAADARFLNRVCRQSRVSGDPEEMCRLTAEGRGILASEIFSLLRKRKVGDMVELPAPSGPVRLPIVGVVKEHSEQQGSLLVARELYARHWSDSTINLVGIYFTSPAAGPEVRQAVASRLGRERRYFLLGNADVRKFVLDLAGQWFGTTYIQIGIAVLIAVLGIVNALTISVTDRARELGVLQAVGGLRNQVRVTVWTEGLLVGGIGLMLGLLLGGVQLYFSLQTTANDISGVRLEYLFPFRLAAILAAVIGLASLLAAIGPAESVVRRPLISALESE